MRFKKSLAAAAVAMALSGAASATDVFVQVYDPTSTETLDAVMTTSVPSATYTAAVTYTIAGWTQFLSSVGNSSSVISHLEFDIVGGVSSGGSGDAGEVTETAANLSGVNSAAGSSAFAQFAYNDVGHIALGSTGSPAAGTYNILAAGASPLNGGWGAPTQFTANGSDFANVTDPNQFWRFIVGSASSTVTELGAVTYNFNATTGTITIGPLSTPTPEPGTYALMAAGLLAVGAIVRRRARR